MWVIQSEVGTVRYFFVPGFNNAYCIGDDGSVWSRYKYRGLGRGRGLECFISNDWKKLSPAPDSSGYLHINLYSNGNLSTKYIHQLVCEAVWGPCPAGMEVCHNDGNPSHNKYWNLRYDTKVGNEADKIIHGTDLRGEKSPNAKRTWVEIREIREKYASGLYTYETLGSEYGLGKDSVYLIIKNLVWKEEKKTNETSIV